MGDVGFQVALVTKARNGTVSILRDLTRQQAEEIKERLFAYRQPPRGTKKENGDTVTTWGFMCQDGDIVECFIV